MLAGLVLASTSSLIAGLVLAAPAGAVVSGHVAGYEAPPSALPTQTVSVTFTVPKIDCKKIPAGNFQAVLAGARLQSVSGNTGGGAVSVCSGPVVAYVPLIEITGVSIGSGITINAGDTVSVNASDGPSGATVTLIDGTQSQTASGPGGSVNAEDVGDIATNCVGSACTPVPKSSVTSYSAASINGTNIVIAGGVQQDLVDVAGGPEMTSSALKTKKTLNAFKVKWVSSCNNGSSRC